MKHIEYGVLVTTPQGHRYLDQTFLAKGSAEDIIRNRVQFLGVKEEALTLVQREVEVILGEWEPVQ